MDLEKLQIDGESSLREALLRIEFTHQGIIIVRNKLGAIIGVSTDGDIRRGLLRGLTLDDAIQNCCSDNFVWADRGTSRELLLKQLDQRIWLIPVLDENRRLVDVVTRDRLPPTEERPVYARARSPVRISFGGGGSDLTYFFMKDGGAVINATITLYSHATLRARTDQRIFIRSRDLNASLEANNLTEAINHPGPFGLVTAILKTVHPDFGFDLYLHSDFPMKSGLGGSAVVAASVLGCFNQFRKDKWDLYELAELAYQAERIYFGVEGGWQDQYATIFGGVNFQEFGSDKNLIHPLRIHADTLLELEESLILCNVDGMHNSGDIHKDQRQEVEKNHIKELVKENVRLTYKIREYLLRGRLFDFGIALDESWQLKRNFSQKISNPALDIIYQSALNHGAIGGKLLGAGGGGFMLFYSLPFRRHELANYLTNQGFTLLPFKFDHEGLKAWMVREHRAHSRGV